MNYGVVVPDVHAARIDVHAESEGTDNRHISTEYLSVLGHVTLQGSIVEVHFRFNVDSS